MRVGAGISSDVSASEAADQAARAAAERMGGGDADLAVLFASGEHLSEPEALLDGVRARLSPVALIGCGAGGVLADGREHEGGSAVAVWAATFDGHGRAHAFHATAGAEEVELAGGPASGVIMLADPYSFPTDAALERIALTAPGTPVVGALASGRTEAGAALFYEDQVRSEGAVGVTLEGVEMLPCVSQGAAPVGREMTITAAHGNVIQELAGRPALQAVEQAIAELDLHERALVATGLLIGIVIDAGRPEYEQGDFLVRGVLGADPDTGAVAVGAPVTPGQVVRLHARDARSADEDLRRELRLRAAALGGGVPAGALVFSCNGRGRAMFGVPDHDAALVARELGGAPAAGLFAAGEIGPVGGRSFLHGFTATLAVFAGEQA
ncbi:MAG: FIST signal transduction protein [Solirubrobacteraceae bacterium]